MILDRSNLWGILLDIVGTFELPPHRFNFLLVEGYLVLALLQFLLLCLDSLVLLTFLESHSTCGDTWSDSVLSLLFLAALINELF